MANSNANLTIVMNNIPFSVGTRGRTYFTFSPRPIAMNDIHAQESRGEKTLYLGQSLGFLCMDDYVVEVEKMKFLPIYKQKLLFNDSSAQELATQYFNLYLSEEM